VIDNPFHFLLYTRKSTRDPLLYFLPLHLSHVSYFPLPVAPSPLHSCNTFLLLGTHPHTLNPRKKTRPDKRPLYNTHTFHTKRTTMARLAVYGAISTILAGGVIANAFAQRSNFYSACIYLYKSNACMMVIITTATAHSRCRSQSPRINTPFYTLRLAR
jgi:hypothetical protein